MALNPSFSAAQSSALPSTIVLTDSSTGSDVLVTSRLITILDAEGNETETVWPYADTTIDLDILTQDAALTITVEWLNNVPAILYTVENSYCFTAYNETFYYGLSVGEVPITNPNQAMSTNYYQNKCKFRTYLDGANQAISFASDIYTSQALLDAATFMNVNSTDFF